MLWIKVAFYMAATFWTPTIQVSLEKVHKKGKRGIFWENTWRDLLWKEDFLGEEGERFWALDGNLTLPTPD
jgi:hypothetical protein